MEEITAALKNIKEVGSFCGKRMISIDKLQIAIKPFGILNLPLKSEVVKELIKVATPARFGWRDQTLLDQKVRDAWEISKDQIKIETASWNQELNAVVELLKKDLGLPETVKLQPNLHNLLIYEPGQFFNYHQDSEKLDGMVATLVIILPSAHKGGALIIDHKGTKKQFQSSRFPIDKLTLIAFYADCHHEVKVLKEGYRLALTYNLTIENDNKINISNEQNYYEPVMKSLRNYFIEELEARSFKQYVYLLEHSYTQKGLSWGHLKNGDILRAKALKVAADLLDLEIYMSLADVQETWNCESDYDYYEYRRRKRKYSYYRDNDDNEEEQDPDLIQVNELIDSSTVLKYWIDEKNQPLEYKECYVSSKYIGWTKACNEFQPFESEYEAYMGNYGNTLDRWYHRAAVILWRKQDHYPILFEMDPNSIINELLMLTEKNTNNTLENKSKVHKIISMLLPCWSKCLLNSHNSEIYLKIFNLALYINDPKLAQAMIFDCNMSILNPEIATLLLSLQDLYGTSWCIDVLEWWFSIKESYNVILKNFSNIVNILYNSNETELTAWLIRYQFNEIIKHHNYCKENHNRAKLIEEVVQRISEIIDLIKACMIVNNANICTELLDQVMANIELYPALDLVNIIVEFKNHSQDLEKWGYKKLFNYVLNLLEQEKKLGLRKIDDWSINEKIPCDCHDCGTLSNFLLDGALTTIKWPLGKGRRQHIHHIIDGLGISVSHQTEHQGSPHKLNLIKTEQLYKEAKKRFSNIEETLIVLHNLR